MPEDGCATALEPAPRRTAIAWHLHALVELRQRDHTQHQIGGSELFETVRDGCDPVEVVDDPVGVKEKAGCHIVAGGRETMSRSR